MQFYIEAPAHHAKAAKTAGLLGGPWIDYAKPKVNEIRSLLARTRQQQGDMIEFAAAISALDDLLRKKAKGDSLEALYVPGAASGLCGTRLRPQPSSITAPAGGDALPQPLLQPFAAHFSFGTVDADFLPYERSTPILDDGHAVLAVMP